MPHKDIDKITLTSIHSEKTAENAGEIKVKYAELIMRMDPEELELFQLSRRVTKLNGIWDKVARHSAIDTETAEEKDYMTAWRELNTLELFLQSPQIHSSMTRKAAFEYNVNSSLLLLKAHADQAPDGGTQEQKDLLKREGKKRNKMPYFKALRMKL